MPSDDINCLLEDRKKVLCVGTSRGLAFGTPSKFQIPPEVPPVLRGPILGVAEDRLGSLWIATSEHVLSVTRSRLLSGTLAEGDLLEFVLADGLRGVEGFKRNRSVVTDPSGRIWFSLNFGISVVDPARLKSDAVAAIARMQSITADGTAIPLNGPIHIPGGRQRVTFSYAGLSLSVPERVRFRYRLDGFDNGWSELTAAREAIYTNLSPGPYHFHVVASNIDGVWSANEAAASLAVDPLLWQTRWFQTLCLVVLAIAAALLYRLRLHQLTNRLNLRFEERLAERTRIAQELHDTLLQGFLSTSMQIHVAADQIPLESAAGSTLSRALQLMSQVIDEGRNAVRGLRSPTFVTMDLEHAFAQIQNEILPESPPREQIGFRVVVKGTRRPLRPLLRDEVYRNGREALVNAFRHAQARSIEMEIGYNARELRVLVRDDGQGIDPTHSTPDATATGASLACANAPGVLAPVSMSGAAPSPGQRFSSLSPVVSPSTIIKVEDFLGSRPTSGAGPGKTMGRTELRNANEQ